MVLALCACGSSASENTLEKQADFTVEGSSESESTSANQDDFTVEDFAVDKIYGGDLYFKLKVRNNTDRNYEFVSIYYQLLDEDGSALTKSSLVRSVSLLIRQIGLEAIR